MLSGAVETEQTGQTDVRPGKRLDFFFALQAAYLLGFPVMPENKVCQVGKGWLSL